MSAASFALILLDDLIFRVKIEDAMKKAGFDYLFAASAKDLNSKLQERRPALIVLDLNYKTDSSLEVITALKSNQKTSGIPVLAYVSHVQVDLKQAALERGCDRVIARSALSQNLPQVLSDFQRDTHL